MAEPSCQWTTALSLDAAQYGEPYRLTQLLGRQPSVVSQALEEYPTQDQKKSTLQLDPNESSGNSKQNYTAAAGEKTSTLWTSVETLEWLYGCTDRVDGCEWKRSPFGNRLNGRTEGLWKLRGVRGPAGSWPQERPMWLTKRPLRTRTPVTWQWISHPADTCRWASRCS